MEWQLKIMLCVLFILLSIVNQLTAQNECIKKVTTNNNFVCVCNATYCDSNPTPPQLNTNEYVLYQSQQSTYRLQTNVRQFSTQNGQQTASFEIDPTQTYQSIRGFGGAFTDSSLINVNSLSERTQTQLLSQYFGPSSIRYNIIRVPMAGTDFSTRPYTYDDNNNDFTLQHWALAPEDIQLKIPYLNRVINMSPYTIQLIACPWSAPPWMKTNHAIGGGSKLLPKFYQLWADYFIKFFQAYNQYGFNFTLVSAQNEPGQSVSTAYTINGMHFDPDEQATFIYNNLGPTLHRNGYGHLELFALDDTRVYLRDWIRDISLNNTKAWDYISGVAVHWYTDNIESANILDIAHNMPELQNKRWILYTESCSVGVPGPPVDLGSWSRGERYLSNIIDDLNNWVTGWIDWNIALNAGGGPNWRSASADSPIIVNSTNDEFYKQPMFYALAHVAPFLTPNSVRIHHIKSNLDSLSSVKMTAFQTNQNQIVMILLNSGETEAPILITNVKGNAQAIDFTMEPHSFATIVSNYT